VAQPAPVTPATTPKPEDHPKPHEVKPKEEPKKQPPKPPALPDDVAKWKKEDYYRARRENSPKLLDAVVRLGEKARGSAPAAQGLTDLLKPLPPAEPPAAGVPPGAATPSAPKLLGLVEKIVAALGNNGTEPARATLEQILAGTLTTDDDKVAVEAALKALAAHPCAENNAILFRVLTAPEALRPADRQGPWPAKDLRNKASS